MSSVIAVVDSILTTVKNCRSLFYDARRRRRVEAIDEHSEVDTLLLEPANKRRKIQSSLFIKSEYLNTIIGYIRNDNIVAIGIHGMGGIGKTTLAMHLYDRILSHDIPAIDIHVTAWVSVGVELTVYQLQEKIAGAFGLDLYGDKDVNRRAAILYSFLSGSGKCILFLDDLWGDFRREDVGIPRQCKIVVISRLLDVCRILRCQKVLKVETLTKEDTWQLFQLSLGYNFRDFKEELSVKNLVYCKSEGLPLAIMSLAKISKMRGMVDASKWKEVLWNSDLFSIGTEKLDDIFNCLKLSFERLNNIKLQRCFLYSALYPKDYAIDREEMIRLWIGEGFVDDVPSSQAQYDMGHSILNKLINSCLLETCQDKRSIKMHDLVRKMALSIARDNFKVKAGIPSNLESLANLHVASFINSSIQMIPWTTFLEFTNLSTLLLQHNPIELIPESFFLHMRALRVLSLSDTRISRLPSSISALEELRVLDLNRCQNLKQVPDIFAELHKLRILDLSLTAIDRVPNSLKMLKMLLELNLSSVILKPQNFPRGVLAALSRLKRLSCHVLGLIQEVQSLKTLEFFDAKFDNLQDLNSYVRSQHWRTLEFFHLQVGHEVMPKRSNSRRVSLQGCFLNAQRGEYIVLPDEIYELYLDDCYGFHSLSDITDPVLQQAEAFTSLEVFSISRCQDVKKLFPFSWMQNIQCLKSLKVEECAQLKELMPDKVEDHYYSERKSEAFRLPQLQQLVLTKLPQLTSIYKGELIFSSLHSLRIMDCPRLKRIPFSCMDVGEKLLPRSTRGWIEGQEEYQDMLQ